MALVEKPGLLVPGWYAIGFQGEDGQINWGAAPIYRYVGDGEWVDEEESPIDSFYDPFLQLRVATNAADAYLPQ